MKKTESQNDALELEDLTILRLDDVLSRTGLSRSKIYDLVAKGEFPHPISLGPRAIGWIKAEIIAWLTDRIHASRNRKP